LHLKAVTGEVKNLGLEEGDKEQLELALENRFVSLIDLLPPVPAKGDFDVKDVERPRLSGPGWAMARVRVSGICGTDLRHWKVANPNLEGKIMGHELAGEVVEVGDEVSNVKAGDRVVIDSGRVYRR